MTKVSPHFDTKEFECRCGCGRYNLNPRLIEILERIRFDFGSPVEVNSACRCEKHNAAVGGGPEHPAGQAVDISCKTSRLRHFILETAYREGVSRVGIAETFIHLGIAADLPQIVTWTYPARKGVS